MTLVGSPTSWPWRASLLLSAASLLVTFRGGDVFAIWSLRQQSVNRSLIDGIRSVRPQIVNARSVLVVGLEPLFNPWTDPEFLSTDLGYRGKWVAAVDPDGYVPPASIEHVSYEAVRLHDYDFVVVFDSDGRLVVGAPPAEILTANPAHGKISDGELVREIGLRQILIKKKLP